MILSFENEMQEQMLPPPPPNSVGFAEKKKYCNKHLWQNNIKQYSTKNVLSKAVCKILIR